MKTSFVTAVSCNCDIAGQALDSGLIYGGGAVRREDSLGVMNSCATP